MLYSCVIALALAYEPIDTNTIVSKDDYSKYDNCDDPGNCAAPCASPQTFHARMCDSFMCNMCPSDWCKESCKKIQEDYPTCRCADWPDHKKTYSASDIPEVVLPTCKDGELVGCHTFEMYYYDALVACPDKLSFGKSDLYYYYGGYTYYPDGSITTGDMYEYGEAVYYGTFLTQGQAHDDMITYTNTELNRASGMVVGGRDTIHMKFECDENPGTSFANEDAFGAQGYVEAYYYSRDGSVVYKVKGECAC
jgi:hypothetical protein